jgi:hypothetical protein
MRESVTGNFALVAGAPRIFEERVSHFSREIMHEHLKRG